MDSIKQSIYQYEQQQKEQQNMPRYAYTDNSIVVQDYLSRFINSLSNNIVKAFEDQKKDYETKIDELHAENKEILTKFNEILTAVTKKKTDNEEIADLQARIQAIYNKKQSL